MEGQLSVRLTGTDLRVHTPYVKLVVKDRGHMILPTGVEPDETFVTYRRAVVISRDDESVTLESREPTIHENERYLYLLFGIEITEAINHLVDRALAEIEQTSAQEVVKEYYLDIPVQVIDRISEMIMAFVDYGS